MAHDHKPMNPIGPGYEVKDASVREVALTGLGLAVGIIIVCIAVIGLFRVLRSVDSKSAQSVSNMQPPQTFPPGPRLQEHPALEFKEMRKNEDQVLTTYGWVNKDAGIVRIPIDRAMEMVVQRGLPVRSATSVNVAQTAPAGGRSNARKP